MRVLTPLPQDDLADVPAAARAAEAAGYDGIVTMENRNEPFLALGVAAVATSRVELHTGIAIAFARSPMAVANAAWDLQMASRGRFVLGLGSQIRAHNENRFSVPWSAPAPRLREYVEALRAIWRAWQTGAKLDYRGQHYHFTLMTPNFTPRSTGQPMVPVTIAAVGPAMLRLAGEVCDGVRLHPFCTRRYVDEVVLPQLAGRHGAKRPRARALRDLGRRIRRHRRRRGGRGPHGRVGPLARGLLRLDARLLAGAGGARPGRAGPRSSTSCPRPGSGTQMTAEISDDVVRLFAAVGTHREIAGEIERRFGGAADAVAISGGYGVQQDVPPDVVRGDPPHPQRLRGLPDHLVSARRLRQRSRSLAGAARRRVLRRRRRGRPTPRRPRPARPPPSGRPTAATRSARAIRRWPRSRATTSPRSAVAWTFRTGETPQAAPTRRPTAFEATPLLVDGTLYFSTPLGTVFALDPTTGRSAGGSMPRSIPRRPSAISPAAACRRGSIPPRPRARPAGAASSSPTMDARLIALDARTGTPCADFGERGTVNLAAWACRNPPQSDGEYGMTSPPAVVNGVVVIGSSVADNGRTDTASGEVRGFDARTGALRWTWDPIPRAASRSGVGQLERRRGAHHRCGERVVADRRRSRARPGRSCRPAARARTTTAASAWATTATPTRSSPCAPRPAKLVWHFQIVHHDLWDYDNASPPALVTVRRDGARRRPSFRPPRPASSSCSTAKPACRSSPCRSVRCPRAPWPARRRRRPSPSPRCRPSACST